MGLPDSKLGWIVLACGVTGTYRAWLMMYWMNGVDYPHRHRRQAAGDAAEHGPDHVRAHGALSVASARCSGCWALNRLPQHHHPLFYSDRFAAFSNDKFFISVEARTRSSTRRRRAAAAGEDAPAGDRGHRDARGGGVVRVLASLHGALLSPSSAACSGRPAAAARPRRSRRSSRIRNMYDQPRYGIQSESEYFADHRTMRPPVEGAVARERDIDPETATGRLADDSGFVLTIPRGAVNALGGTTGSLSAARSATASTAHRATTRPAAATARSRRTRWRRARR